jgi:hypothetical protein
LLPLIACTFRLLVLKGNKGQAHRWHTAHRCHIDVENPSPAKAFSVGIGDHSDATGKRHTAHTHQMAPAPHSQPTPIQQHCLNSQSLSFFMTFLSCSDVNTSCARTATSFASSAMGIR